MGYDIEFSKGFDKDLLKLDPQHKKRILDFLNDRVSQLNDPRSIGEALSGPKLGAYWKYRIGDYRLIARIEDNRLLIVILEFGHRKDVYRPRK